MHVAHNHTQGSPQHTRQNVLADCHTYTSTPAAILLQRPSHNSWSCRLWHACASHSKNSTMSLTRQHKLVQPPPTLQPSWPYAHHDTQASTSVLQHIPFPLSTMSSLVPTSGSGAYRALRASCRSTGFLPCICQTGSITGNTPMQACRAWVSGYAPQQLAVKAAGSQRAQEHQVVLQHWPPAAAMPAGRRSAGGQAHDW